MFLVQLDSPGMLRESAQSLEVRSVLLSKSGLEDISDCPAETWLKEHGLEAYLYQLATLWDCQLYTCV